jgi:hypothetical protein
MSKQSSTHNLTGDFTPERPARVLRRWSVAELIARAAARREIA